MIQPKIVRNCSFGWLNIYYRVLLISRKVRKRHVKQSHLLNSPPIHIGN